MKTPSSPQKEEEEEEEEAILKKHEVREIEEEIKLVHESLEVVALDLVALKRETLIKVYKLYIFKLTRKLY